MTIVRVTCPLCDAEQGLEDTAFRLTLLDTGAATYEYFCPNCRDHVVRPADHRARSILTLARVKTYTVHVPAEFLQPKSGEPINDADVADFDLSFEEWTTECCVHPWT